MTLITDPNYIAPYICPKCKKRCWYLINDICETCFKNTVIRSD